MSTLARPKFSLFQSTGEALLERLQGKKAHQFTSESHEKPYHVGFDLQTCMVPVNNVLRDYQLRDYEEIRHLLTTQSTTLCKITYVYLPLLAVLLPKWETILWENGSSTCQKIIYLISGAGIPHDTTSSLNGNSTETIAQLMKIFLHWYAPSIEVVLIHSGSDIFRYDENVTFMNQQLRPSLESYRQPLVYRSGDQWKSHFHVTIAYADGTPARLSALNASLRIYRPSYLHFWQLKTFWHKEEVSLDDVDFHSFEKIETSPALVVNNPQVQQTHPLLRDLVDEMIKFRDEFLQSLQDIHGNEILSFWLRKSRRPVLAVLMVVKDRFLNEEKPKPLIYRGLNAEVSMPTGSLCAERNAIGSALAHDPTLKRHEIKMIGVLAVGVMPSNPRESSPSMSASSSVASLFLSAGESNNNELEETEQSSPIIDQCILSKFATPLKEGRTSSFADDRSYVKRQRLLSSSSDTFVEQPFGPLLHIRKAPIQDRNPLAPCGACKEWLLKIAESNPALLVVTFTNSKCEEVFLNQLI